VADDVMLRSCTRPCLSNAHLNHESVPTVRAGRTYLYAWHGVTLRNCRRSRSGQTTHGGAYRRALTAE